MHRLLWLFLFSLLITACSKNSQPSTSLPQDKFIQVYFNHRENSAEAYTDPYRKVERAGDDLEAVIIQEIAAAENTIDLAVQELNLPLVAQALAKKSRSGVKVRVILDNNYSRPWRKLNNSEIKALNRRDRQKYQQLFQLIDIDLNGQISDSEIEQRNALAILKQAGIPLIDDTADGSKGSGLMHHKFMVVDRQIVVTGSANFTLSGIHGDFDNLATRGNANHLLRIEQAQVAALFTEEFDYMWGNFSSGANSKFGSGKPWRSPKSLVWENTKLTVQFAPTSSQQPWQFSTNGLIAKTLKDAKESIDLALFVFSAQEIADVLQQKHQAGIDIKGVFDRDFAYRYYSEVLDLLGVTLYRNCQAEDNNNPWTNPLSTVGTAQLATGDKLHHKFTVIDRQTVISGSSNWSEAANQSNDEAIIIIDNFTVAEQFAQEFEHLYSKVLLELSSSIKNKLVQQQSCS